MSRPGSACVRLVARCATLDAVLARERDALQADYRVCNTGAVPLLVFDRGDRHAVLTRRQAAGAVGVPVRFESAAGVTLLHLARALPMPTPTLPPTPLAREVAPGTCVDATFRFSRWRDGVPARVRWCVGIAEAEVSRLCRSETHGDVVLWEADFGYADDQVRLCTPWFDMTSGRFEASSD